MVSLALACASVAASAQYVWLDGSGRKVFSDRPPPMDVPQRAILREPRSGIGPIVVAPAPSVPAQPPQGTRRASGQDSELAERRMQAEAAEAAKAQAERTRVAAAKAENCQRAQQASATFNSGVRIAQVNAQGERSFMDEQTRAAEAERAQSIVASDCR